MTVNQLTYARLKEDQRANRAKEMELNRSNLAQEQLGRSNLAEVSRHNVEAEKETNRHNVTTERLTQAAQDEAKRSNIAREVETNRANLAKEVETNRSNVARETETLRSNVAKETETSRANKAQENIGASNVAAKFRDLEQQFKMWQRGQLPESRSRALLNQANALLARAKVLEANTNTSFAWFDRLQSIIEALIPG